MRLNDQPLNSAALLTFVKTLTDEFGKHSIAENTRKLFAQNIVEPMSQMVERLKDRPEIAHEPTLVASGGPAFTWNVRDIIFKEKWDSYPKVKLQELRQQLASLCNASEPSEQPILKTISYKAVKAANKVMESRAR